MTSRPDTTSSLFLAVNLSAPNFTRLNPTTDTPSRVVFPPAKQRTGAVRVALLVLRAYKIFISPYFRGACRFLPSCADFAAEAIERHGVIVGGWLAMKRLGRCHPLGRAGLDPVPLRNGR